MEEREYLQNRESAPRSFLRVHRREIGTAVFVVLMFTPIIFVYKLAQPLEIEGTIVGVDNDGTVWINGKLDGIDFEENIVGWKIKVKLLYITISGRVEENEFPVIPWWGA